MIRGDERRDAEVQQVRLAVGRDEDVAWLQIAMDDEIAVRELHRAADLQKQAEPVVDGERRVLAVVVDAPTVDVFHDEIGQSLFGCAAIEEPRDQRMFELGEDLPLAAKAPQQIFVAERRRDDFDRHLLVEGVIGAGGEIDRAHAAASNLPDDLIRAKPPAAPADRRGGELARRLGEERVSGAIVCGEQGAHARAPVEIRTLSLEQGVAFRRRQVDRAIEQVTLGQGGGVHAIHVGEVRTGPRSICGNAAGRQRAPFERLAAAASASATCSTSGEQALSGASWRCRGYTAGLAAAFARARATTCARSIPDRSHHALASR